MRRALKTDMTPGYATIGLAAPIDLPIERSTKFELRGLCLPTTAEAPQIASPSAFKALRLITTVSEGPISVRVQSTL
jgi:hypothetical protein